MLTAFILLFILFLLFIIPVEIVFNYRNFGNPVRRIKISWLFGIVSFPIYPNKTSSKTKKINESPKEKTQKGPGFSKLIKILRNGKFTEKTVNTGRQLLGSARAELSSFYLRLGLGDPVDTGILWGLLGPLSGIAYGFTNKIQIEPDFLDAGFEIDTEGKVSIIPLEIIFIFLGYLLSPVVFKTYWLDIRSSG